jgi:hypothetical protein
VRHVEAVSIELASIGNAILAVNPQQLGDDLGGSIIAHDPTTSTRRVVPIVENEIIGLKTEFLPPRLPPDG